MVYAPSVGIGQIDGDYGSFSRLSLDDYYPFYPDIGTSTKINYYTPRIAGFQAGISYSPYLSDNGQSVVAFRPGRVRATTASALLAEPVFGKRRSPNRHPDVISRPQDRDPRRGAPSGAGRSDRR